MSTLFSSIAVLMVLVSSCGNENLSQSSSLAGGGSRGRLTCTGFSEPSGRQENISGCTESSTLAASSPSYGMTVVRNGSDLSISLQNRKTGESWNGSATLRFPIGGTGTRARVLVQQPILSLLSCELDTLLRCQ